MTAASFIPVIKELRKLIVCFAIVPFIWLPNVRENRSLSWNGKTIKDCSNCVYPHKPENYEHIMKWLSGQGQAE